MNHRRVFLKKIVAGASAPTLFWRSSGALPTARIFEPEAPSAPASQGDGSSGTTMETTFGPQPTTGQALPSTSPWISIWDSE